MSARLITKLFWLFVGFDPLSLGVSFSLEVQRGFGVDICLHAKVAGFYFTLRSNLIPPKSVVGNELTPDDVDEFTPDDVDQEGGF